MENPLPGGLSDDDLAECFAIFFITKIENIRDNLNSHPLYNLIENCATGKLTKFKLLSAEGIRNLVRKMQMKLCELDYLPTYIPKYHIDTFISVLTKIVNFH